MPVKSVKKVKWVHNPPDPQSDQNHWSGYDHYWVDLYEPADVYLFLEQVPHRRHMRCLLMVQETEVAKTQLSGSLAEVQAAAVQWAKERLRAMSGTMLAALGG